MSDDGWDPTLQYQTNPIVSDSDDESNIIRTENRAIRKKKSKNKVTPRQNPSNHVYVLSYIPPPPFRGGPTEQNKNTTQYALVTTLHKQTQLTSIRHEPSYKQLEVKINIVLNNDRYHTPGKLTYTTGI